MLDVDIQKYFDSISHCHLRRFLDQRVIDDPASEREMANDFMNCRIRTSFRLLSMAQRKNNDETRANGGPIPIGTGCAVFPVCFCISDAEALLSGNFADGMGQRIV